MQLYTIYVVGIFGELANRIWLVKKFANWIDSAIKLIFLVKE